MSNRLHSHSFLYFAVAWVFLLGGVPAGAVTLNFVTGWNLVGNSVNAPLTVAKSFNNSNDVVTLWKWQPATGRWAFYTPLQADAGAAYAAGRGYDLLTAINAGESFWVNAKQAFSFTLPRSPPYSLASANLTSGWNLVTTGDSVTPAQLDAKLGGTAASPSFSTMWAWNPASSKWYFFSPSLAANNTLAAYIQSKGYLDFGSLAAGEGLGFWLNSNTTASATSTTFTGSVVKGSVSGATVTFFALNPDGSKGAQLGSTTTDSAGTGTFSVSLTPAPTTPFMAQSSGGNYVDEATGAISSLAATDVLSAVLPGGITRATVTPLTHIAAARALALAAAGTPLEAAVDASNIAVAQQYGVNDILTTLPIPANDANRVLTASLAERQYGLVLAGFAQSAKTLGARPIDLAAAIATDASDGLLDGSNNGTPIRVPLATGAFYLPTIAGTENIQTAINAYLALTNNKSGLDQMSIVPTPVPIGVNLAGMLYTTSTLLPAAVDGQAYIASVAATGGTPPYTCSLRTGSALPAGYGLSNTCQITGTGALVGGSAMSVYGPFTVVLQDSAIPPSTVEITLNLTTVSPPPVILTTGGKISVNTFSNIRVATAAGGVAPHHFYQDTFMNGFPPLGMVVQTDGTLQGKTQQSGTFKFGVCVADQKGAIDCQPVTVTVEAAAQDFQTFTGAFNGSGTASRNYGGSPPDICSFAEAISGTLNFYIVSGSSDSANDGQYLSLAGSLDETVVTGKCAPPQQLTTTWSNNLEKISSSTPNLSGTLDIFDSTAFIPEWIVNFSGTLSGNTISGTLVITIKDAWGASGSTISIPVTLTKQ